MEIVILLTIVNSLAIVALLAGQHWHHSRIGKVEGRFRTQDAAQDAVARSLIQSRGGRKNG